MNTETIIGFINTTMKGYSIATRKGLTKERAAKIIDAIVGDTDAFSPETKEILDYCHKYYDYQTKRHTHEQLFDHVNEAYRYA